MKRVLKKIILSILAVFTAVLLFTALKGSQEAANVQRIEITDADDLLIPAGIKDSPFYRGWKLLADKKVKYGSLTKAYIRSLDMVLKNGLNCADFASWLYFSYLPEYEDDLYDKAQLIKLREELEASGKGGGTEHHSAKWWHHALSRLDYNEKLDERGERIVEAVIYDPSLKARRSKNGKTYNSALRLSSIRLEEAITLNSWDDLKPGAIITMFLDDHPWDPCHVMVYLGQWDGYIYVCHSSTTKGHPVNIWRYELNKKPVRSALSDMFAVHAGSEGHRIAAFNVNLPEKSVPVSIYVHKTDNLFNDLQSVSFTLENTTTKEKYYLEGMQDEEIDDDRIISSGRYLYIPVPVDDKGTDTSLKTGKYVLKEEKAAFGYKNTGSFSLNGGEMQKWQGSYEFEVSRDNYEFSFEIANDPQPAKVQIHKTVGKSKELIKSTGRYSLAGTKFRLYQDQNCSITACDLEGNEAILTIDETAISNILMMQEGIYWLKETQAADGFKLNETVTRIMLTRENETIPLEVTIENEPIFREDYPLIIKKDSDGNFLKDVEFTVFYFTDEIKSVAEALKKTPLFSWNLKTDKDGLLYLNKDNLVSGDKLFYADNKAVLPAGNYLIKETKPLEGYMLHEPVLMQVSEDISRNPVYILNNGERLNADEPVLVNKAYGYLQIKKLSTIESYQSLINGSGAEFEVFADENASVLIAALETNENALTEKITLEPGTYYIKETKCPKGHLLNDQLYIVEIKEKDDIVLEIHNDPIPQIKTSASFMDNGLKLHFENDTYDVTDNVVIEGLIINNNYVLKGRVIDFESKEILLEGEVSFAAEKENMTINLSFESVPPFRKAVIQEELYLNGKLISLHTDLNNELQTLRTVRLQTTADTSDSNKLLPNAGKQIIYDHIQYDCLITGQEYRVKTRVYDATTNSFLKDGTDRIIEEEQTFTCEKEKGELTVTIEIETDKLTGHKLVVFEEIYFNDSLIAVHCDKNSESQSVTVRSMKTKATYKGFEIIDDAEKLLIEDLIEMNGLSKGKEYIVRGTLIDTENNQYLLDKNSFSIQKEITFTADKEKESVIMQFEVDPELIEGKAITIGQCLYENETLLVKHEDVNDKEQTLDPLKLKVSINKYDAASLKPLQYAKFMLVDKDGLAIADESGKEILLETDENGYANVTLLYRKEPYYLKEILAPDGYQLNEELIQVEIDHSDINNLQATVNAFNHIIDIPQTGDETKLHSLLMLMVSVISSSSAIFLIKERKE